MLTLIATNDFDIEDFDDEIVLVNFHNGIYFTIKGSGPAIFRAFHNGLDMVEFTTYIDEELAPEMLTEVQNFIEQLYNEGILVDVDSKRDVKLDWANLKIMEAPIIEKFDDVSDLIKLDPIHDVSDLGWPHKK